MYYIYMHIVCICKLSQLMNTREIYRSYFENTFFCDERQYRK